ncbi:MAG: glycosyltransferase family 2 protein [Clostridia bacterium]|nr:glycosyltransferase family 2 protein [Clostridia bacterium]
MKKVAVVVVTFNRKDLLCKNIEALLKQSCKEEQEIYIIDNASTDGTYEAILPFIEAGKIQYRNTGKNLGGAGGFHFGMKEALSADHPYLWLMDDDTIPQENALEELLAADQVLEGHYGFLSGTALWKDGSPCKMNKQKTIQNWYDEAQHLCHGLLRCYHATFVSFFIRAEVVKKVGLPIKEFFIWGDDVEYSNRIHKQYPCYIAGKSQVLHDTANNEGSNIARDDASRIGRYRFAYRNEMYIAKQNGLKGLLRQGAKIGLHLARVLLHGDHKFKKWSVILGSSFKGIFFHPKIEYIEE